MPVAEATNGPGSPGVQITMPRVLVHASASTAKTCIHISPRGRQCPLQVFSDVEIRGISYMCDGKNHHELQDGKTGKTEAKKSCTPRSQTQTLMGDKCVAAGVCRMMRGSDRIVNIPTAVAFNGKPVMAAPPTLAEHRQQPTTRGQCSQHDLVDSLVLVYSRGPSLSFHPPRFSHDGRRRYVPRPSHGGHYTYRVSIAPPGSHRLQTLV